MPFITAKDGAEIFYKDWGTGTPIVFSHGWPLNADAWDAQMMFLGAQGYRVIAHDRRGHGRSTQTWDGNEMDTYADDLAALFEALDLKDTIMIGHSTGGGEVAHYLGRHGSSRVQKAVLIGAVPPIMLKSDTNPGGLPIDVFDGIRAGTLGDRSQFFKDLAMPFYGYNKPGAKISQGVIDNFWY
jgi:non-heme chloroperoxidase